MDSKLYNLLKNFSDYVEGLSPLSKEMPRYLMVSSNGEICYNTLERVFDVWDETYTCKIGTTIYPLVAYYMLKSYGDHCIG